MEYPSRTYLTEETSHASQRWLKAALVLSKCGKCPISQQQHPTSSSTPSEMASTSLCWQYVPRNSNPRTCSEYHYIQGVSRLVSQMRRPFSRTHVDESGCPFMCWTSNVVGLIFWKKILKFLILPGSGPGTSSDWFSGSAWFWAWSRLSFPRVFNFLAWKPLHMVNLTSKYEFLGQIYHVKWFSGQKVEYPRPT